MGGDRIVAEHVELYDRGGRYWAILMGVGLACWAVIALIWLWVIA
jgi:hypothetical protein